MKKKKHTVKPMFSLSRYLLSKANKRLYKASVREEKRQQKAVKKGQ
jgi:hypothetical protein